MSNKILSSLVAFFVLSCSSLYGADFYVSPSGAGAASGANCDNPKAIGSLNWVSDLGGNDTLHLCSGSYTSTLTIGRSGTSSESPLTIVFENGAKLSKTVWGTATNAAIYIAGKDYIVIDGNNVGVIENTDNGTIFGSQSASQGVYITGGSNNTIKNLTVKNLYVRTAGSNTDSFTGDVFGIYAKDTDELIVDNNTVYDTKYCLKFSAQSGNADGLYVRNNKASRMATGIVVASESSGGSYTNIYINDNKIFDTHVWDGSWSTGVWHHRDGIHTWGQSGYPSTIVGPIYIYNNEFYGLWATASHVTAHIYLSDFTSPAYIYNNLFYPTDTAPSNGYIDLHTYSTASAFVYNNTFVGLSSSISGFYFVRVASSGVWSVKLRNNIFHSAYVAIEEAGSDTVWDSDYNDFYNNGSFGRINESTEYRTLVAWQTHLGGCPGTGNDCNSITSNPDLDASYKPSSAESPVVDAGATMSADFTTDKDGNSRPFGAAWDIGAYEYGSGTPTLTIPQGVHIGGGIRIE